MTVFTKEFSIHLFPVISRLFFLLGKHTENFQKRQIFVLCTRVLCIHADVCIYIGIYLYFSIFFISISYPPWISLVHYYIQFLVHILKLFYILFFPNVRHLNLQRNFLSISYTTSIVLFLFLFFSQNVSSEQLGQEYFRVTETCCAA